MNGNQDGVQELLDRWCAAERAGDGGALREILTDDFAGVGALGFVLGKEAWIGRLGTGRQEYEDFRVSDVAVHPYGDAALAVARVDQPGAFQGKPTPAAARASLMLVRPDGRWHIAGASMTFIAGTPGAPPMPAH